MEIKDNCCYLTQEDCELLGMDPNGSKGFGFSTRFIGERIAKKAESVAVSNFENKEYQLEYLMGLMTTLAVEDTLPRLLEES